MRKLEDLQDKCLELDSIEITLERKGIFQLLFAF